MTGALDSAGPALHVPPMTRDQWFPDGIVLRGTRSGVVERIPEPYSAESAERLAKTYASLWLEPIEWWGIGSEETARIVAAPKRLELRGRRPGAGSPAR